MNHRLGQRMRIGLLCLILAILPIKGYTVDNEDNTTPSNNVILTRIGASAGSRVVGDSFPAAKSFALILPQGQASVSISAKAEDAKATITVDGIPVPNGAPSELIQLKHGMNKLDVLVTAADGKTQKHYLLKIIRAYATPNWTRVVEKTPFVPRDSAGELVFNNRMWIFGGYIPDVISDVWSSADGKTWEQGPDIPDKAGVNIPVVFTYKGKMWVATNNSAFYNSSDGQKWTQVSAQLPAGGGSAVFKDKMWIVGGTEGREVWSSSDGKDWKLEVAKAPWSQRTNFGNVVAHDGKLWLIGGPLGNYQPFKAYSDVWCSEDGVKWKQVTDHAPWTPRRWTCCVVYRNRIWQLGGFRGQPVWTNLNDVWYSADGKNWKQLVTDDVWAARHELSGYAFDGKLWVVAGNVWPLVNDVWELNIPGMVFMTQPVLEEYVGARYEYRPEAEFNESAKPIHYRLVDGPKWLSMQAKTGVISGTPTEIGEYPVVIEAYDDAGETVRQSYSVLVSTL